MGLRYFSFFSPFTYGYSCKIFVFHAYYLTMAVFVKPKHVAAIVFATIKVVYLKDSVPITACSQYLPQTGYCIEDCALTISSTAVILRAAQHCTLQMFKKQGFLKTGNNMSQVATS